MKKESEVVANVPEAKVSEAIERVEPKIEKIEQPTAPVVRQTSKPKKSTPAKIEETEESDGRRIVRDLEVDVKYQPSSPKHIKAGYTGYMVEFFTSSGELPLSHEIFSKHGKIYKEVEKNGNYAYLFGPFGEWRDANRFLQSAVSSNYDNAKVVRYKNGKRIEKK